jgi:hypothetical protein
MTSLTLLGDTSGSIVLDAPAVSGSTTITLAAQSGTLNVGGPAFSAYGNAYTNITANVATKILFQVEEYDTANCFASSRFTPNVAGYYAFSTGVGFVDSNGSGTLALYKNGSPYKYLIYVATAGGAGGFYGSCQAYANGTTDYFEIYINEAHSQRVAGNQDNGYFQGCFMRSA